MEKHYKMLNAIFLLAALLTFSNSSSAQTLTWYRDVDGDGWGDPAVNTISATQPAGYVLNNKDCDDSRYNQTKWKELKENSIGRYMKPGFTVSASGVPYIAFADSAYKCTVKKFDGTNWVFVGPKGFSQSIFFGVTIVTDNNGTPYVAYSSSGGSFVMKYNGTSWVNVGSTGFSQKSAAGKISLAIDKTTNNPVVAYRDNVDGYGTRLTVKKYNGTSWVTVGTPGFFLGMEPSLAINGAGIPYIAYQDSNVEYKITVRKYDETSWVTVGREGFASSMQSGTALLLDSLDIPYVTCIDGDHYNKGLTIKKYADTGWVNIGPTAFSNAPAYNANIAIDISGVPYVIYADVMNANRATVRKYVGNKWVLVGNTGFSKRSSKWTSPDEALIIATDSLGVPYVIYEDATSDALSYYKFIVMKAEPQPLATEVSINVVYTANNATFSAKNIYGGSAPIYTWYKNRILVSGAKSNTCTTMINNHDTVYCTINGNDICATSIANSNKIIALQKTWYRDIDGDGMGDSAMSTLAFIKPSGYVLNKMDCDDTKPNTKTWNTIDTPEISLKTAFSYPFSHTVSADGVSYLAYADSAYANKATVKRFDGKNWITVGKVGFSEESITYIKILINSSGIPYVVYSQDTKGYVFMKYNGTDWVDLSYKGPGGVFDLSVNAKGDIYVVGTYDYYAGGFEPSVVKYDGTEWKLVGDVSFTDDVADEFKITIDPVTSTPYVVFSDYSNTSIMKYDGTDWVNVGKQAIPAGADLNIAFDVNTSIPYIAYSGGPQSRATVMRFEAEWVPVGDTCFSADIAGKLNLAIDLTGIPYVVYSDWANNQKATVMKFDGTDWISAGTGVSSNSANEMGGIALDGKGVPYISFADIKDGNKIYIIKPTLKLFNDSLDIIISDTVITSDSVTFTAQPLYGGSAPTYRWYKNDTLISGVTSSTYTTKELTLQDTISCVMISDYACATSTPAYSNKIGGIVVTPPDTTGGDSTVGINNLYASTTRIALYPIPAKEILNIQWSNTTTGKSVIKVYDMTGKEVLNGVYTLSQTHEMVSLPLNGLAPGAYFIKATLNGELVPAQKFIKN